VGRIFAYIHVAELSWKVTNTAIRETVAKRNRQ